MSTINVDQVLAQMRQLTAAAQGEQTNAPGQAVGGADFSELLKTSIDKVNSYTANSFKTGCFIQCW